MINASTDFIQAIQDGRTDYLMQISVTLKSGTTITLDEEKIWGDSVKLEDATAQGDDFAVGAFVSTKLSFSINNMSGAYSDDILYNFADAEMSVELGLDIDGTVEYITLGTFWVDDVDYDGSLISFVCTDRARFFNKPYTSVYNSGTATIRQLLTEAVVTCLGSSSYLMSETFPNEDYTVKLPFSHDSITFADVVAMVAQLGGCFAKIGADGKLYIKTYPTISEYIHPDNRYDPVYAEGHGYHVIRSLKSAKIQKHDCQVTKISVIEETGDSEPGTASYPTGGADDYVIEVSGNRLISAGQSYSAALGIWSVVGGRRFRPLSISTLTNPLIEAGDVMYVVTGKDYEYSELKTRGNDYINTADDKRINAGKLSDGIYFSFITSRSMTLGSGVTIECAGAPVVADGQAQTSYTELSKAIAKERQIADINEQRAAAAREQLEESIYNSLGLYQTEETQPGGGVIKYYHDKPELSNSQYIWKFDADSITVSADGGVHWSAAFDARGNALLKYLAVDQISATWIKTGILDADLLTTGTIQSPNNPDNYWNLATGELHLGGSDIVTVSNVIYEYATGSDPVNAPETGWSTSSPEWSSTEYIWARSVTIYTDGDSVTGTPVCIQGPAGSTGPRGVSIVAATPEYAMNTSMEVAPPSSSFTPDIPELPAPEVGQPNYYIWTRFKVEYSEGSPTYSTPKVDTALNAYYLGYHTFINDTDHLKSEYEKLERYVGYSTIITHNDGEHILIEDGTESGKQIAVMTSNMVEMLSETTRTFNTKLEQTAEQITAAAASTYETKNAAQTKYGELYAGIEINAEGINSVAERTEKQYNSLSEFAGISGILTKSNEYIVTQDSPEGDNRKPIVSVSGVLYDTMREIQTSARTEIQQTADAITQTAAATYATQSALGTYVRESNSKIDQTAEEITLQVNKRVKRTDLDGNQFDGAEEDSTAQIHLKSDAITSVVVDDSNTSLATFVNQTKNEITQIASDVEDEKALAGFYNLLTNENTAQYPSTGIGTKSGESIVANAGDIFNRLHLLQAENATAIQQTEDRIALVATDMETNIAAIQVYADRINMRAEDAYGNAGEANLKANTLEFYFTHPGNGLLWDAENNKLKLNVAGAGLEIDNGALKFKLSDVILNIKNGLNLTFGDIDGLGSRFSWTAENGLQINLGQSSSLYWDNNGNLKVNVSSLSINAHNVLATSGNYSEAIDSVFEVDENGIRIKSSKTRSLMRVTQDALGHDVIQKLNTSTNTYEDVTTYAYDTDGDLVNLPVSDAILATSLITNSKPSLQETLEKFVAKLSGNMFTYTVESGGEVLEDGSLEFTSKGVMSLFGAKQLTLSSAKLNLNPEGVRVAFDNVSDFISFSKSNQDPTSASYKSDNTAAIKFKYGSGSNDVYSEINKNGMYFYAATDSNNRKPKIAEYTQAGVNYYAGAYQTLSGTSDQNPELMMISAGDRTIKFKTGNLLWHNNAVSNPSALVIDGVNSEIRFYAGEFDSDYLNRVTLKINKTDGVVINYPGTSKKCSQFSSDGLKFYANTTDNDLNVTFKTLSYLEFSNFYMLGAKPIIISSNNTDDMLRLGTNGIISIEGSINGPIIKARSSSAIGTSNNQDYNVYIKNAYIPKTITQDIYPPVASPITIHNSISVQGDISATGNLSATYSQLDAENGRFRFSSDVINGYYRWRFRDRLDNDNDYFIDVYNSVPDASKNNAKIYFGYNVYFDESISAANVYNRSDLRLKKNISQSTVKALEALTAIDIKSFDIIKDDRHVTAGIIAQQLREVAPELVQGDTELSINSTELLNYCVKAIQELADIVGYKPKKKAEWKDPYTLEEKLAYNELHSHK